MKKALALFVAVALGLSMTACGGAASSSGVASSTGSASSAGGASSAASSQAAGQGGEILIGCLQDVTGATSSLGQMVQAGAQWAVDEINANGGINGQTIKMNTYDTKGDVTEAVNAFTKAVTVDKVSIIVGPPVANIALAIKETSEQYNVPVMGLALDKNAQLKTDGTPYKNMFSFQPNADQQGAIMAKYAIKNNFKTFGAIYNESNAYSTSLLPPFVETVEGAGGTLPKELQIAYNANDTDFKTLLAPIVNAKVDAIFVPNYTKDLVNITTAARAIGYEGALVCGLDACPPFNTMLGGSCDGIYYINNIDDTQTILQEMIKAVKDKTGIDATNKFFLGYDIVQIAAQVLGETGTEDPEAVRSAIENVTSFEGFTVNITIDPKTHMTSGMEMVMFTYEGTTPKLLEKFAA